MKRTPLRRKSPLRSTTKPPKPATVKRRKDRADARYARNFGGPYLPWWDHGDYIRSQPCAFKDLGLGPCRGRIECAHVLPRSRMPGKETWNLTVPGCFHHHQEVYELEFANSPEKLLESTGIDLIAEAESYAAHTRREGRKLSRPLPKGVYMTPRNSELSGHRPLVVELEDGENVGLDCVAITCYDEGEAEVELLIRDEGGVIQRVGNVPRTRVVRGKIKVKRRDGKELRW